MSQWIASCYQADSGVDGSGNPLSATSITGNLTRSAPVGDTILLAICGGGGKTVSSITDTQGNTWTVDQTLTSGTVETAVIARCNVARALSTSDTITITFSGTNAFHMAVGELYTGTLTPDTGATCTPATSTAPTSALTGTTAHSVETVFGCLVVGGGKTRPSFTPTAGYTTRSSNSQVNNTTNSGRDVYSMDHDTTAAGNQVASGTLSASQPWDIICQSYAISGGGGGGGTGQTLLAGGAVSGGTANSVAYPGFALRSSGPDITGAATTYPWAKTVNLLQNWSVIEATDNTFDFSTLDVSMQYAIDNSIQCGIRIEMALDGSPSWIYGANSLGPAVQSLTTYTSPSDPTGAQTPVPWDPTLRLLWQRLCRHVQTFLQTAYNGKKYADVCAFVAVSGPTALAGTEMTIGDEGDSRNTANWNAVLNGQTARQSAYITAWQNHTLDALTNISAVSISVANGTVWGDGRQGFMNMCDWLVANLAPSQLARVTVGPTDMRVDQPGAVGYAAWSSAADVALRYARSKGLRTWAQSAGWSWWGLAFNGGTLKAIQTAYLTDAVGIYQVEMMESNTQILGNVAGLPAWCQNTLQPAILAQQPVGGGSAAAYGATLVRVAGNVIAAGFAAHPSVAQKPSFAPGAVRILAGHA